MNRGRSKSALKYRLHKATTQARVTDRGKTNYFKQRGTSIWSRSKEHKRAG